MSRTHIDELRNTKRADRRRTYAVYPDRGAHHNQQLRFDLSTNQ